MSLSFLQDPSVRLLMETLDGAGFQSLVVGGAARDGLRGITPKDIDLATNARPETVEALLAPLPNVTMHPTGLDHGTWTAAVDGFPIEITTFRRDVSTDGRRASIAYADTFAIDAERRDFTINALGIEKDGTIHDPTGKGLKDLEKGIVRFVGKAQDRCDEDALRVLRLFRFQGRMGQWPMDQEALEAASNTSLAHISGERIWSEMKGIMQTPNSLKVAKAMHETGVWNRVLPNTPLSFNRLEDTLGREQEAGLDPHWGRRLYALTGRAKLPYPMAGIEARHLMLIDKYHREPLSVKALAAATENAEVAQDCWTLTGKGNAKTVKDDATFGSAATLPLRGKDLLDKGVKPGPSMGNLLDKAKKTWLESDLVATQESLLATVLPKSQDYQR